MSDERQDQNKPVEALSNDRTYQLVDKWLDIQLSQVELQRQHITQSYQQAREVLQAQLEDRNKDRDYLLKARRDRIYFAGFLVLLLATFLALAMYFEKDQMALKIVEWIGVFGAGAIGGYGFCRYQLSRTGDRG